MLDENCQKHNGPMGDYEIASSAIPMSGRNNNGGKGKSKKGNRREQHYVVRDLVTCLALCHNVTPTYPDPDDPTVREFQASSPDEIALVKFADH
jgi:phospholipid-translocating ATPase